MVECGVGPNRVHATYLRMKTLLYDDLVRFYHLLDPLEDHREEAQEFGGILAEAVPGARRLLELGAGAGHGAYYVKERFSQVTLADLSPSMLARSKALNPDCGHVEADMRAARLGRTFDCVLIHDAITYMISEDDLLRAATTAFEHLRSGGAALLVPDCTKETFRDSYEDHAGDDGTLSLRCISWSHDPDPTDTTHLTDFAFLLREDGEVHAVHDRHVFGLFGMGAWVRVLKQAGFHVRVIERPLPREVRDSPYTDRMFLCLKR